MTPQSERIASLDVLRGLGILGILAVNAAFFAMPIAVMADPQVLGPMNEASASVWSVVRIGFERKFVTLFAMLFGASILLVGGDDKQDPERSRNLTRRLGWLLLFGLIHGAAVWYGDILLTYAVAGFIAAQLRGWPAGRLFAAGAAVYLLFALMEAGSYWLLAIAPAGAADAGFSAEAARAEIEAFRGSLGQVQLQNLRNWSALLGGGLLVIPSTCGLMLVGMGLFKTGVLLARRGVAFYLFLLAAGGLALWGIAWAALREAGAGFDDWSAFALFMTLNVVLAPAATLGYLALVCLVLKSPVRALAAPLAATGQMAFTNYICQSLIMTGIFWAGRGLGLFGSFSYAELAFVVAGVWLLQLIWSPLWMRFFRYGPLEWIWRRLTYAQPVAFRR